jgi:hypothetical protein
MVGRSRKLPPRWASRWASRAIARMCGGVVTKLKAGQGSRTDRRDHTVHRTRPVQLVNVASLGYDEIAVWVQLGLRASWACPRRRCIVFWSATD